MEFQKAQSAVGARIRELRTASGLTQEGLAEASGLHVSYVAQVERGERNPSLKSLLAIADGLGVRLAGLFQGWAG